MAAYETVDKHYKSNSHSITVSNIYGAYLAAHPDVAQTFTVCNPIILGFDPVSDRDSGYMVWCRKCGTEETKATFHTAELARDAHVGADSFTGGTDWSESMIDIR